MVGASTEGAWRDELAGVSIFHRLAGEHPSDDAVRVLAVDGGGIRGVIPALVAAELEERSGRPICELFDFIVGTSTGSIIAMGSATPDIEGKPKWTARDGATLYMERGHEFFSKPKMHTGVFHEKYRHGVFEALAGELWGNLRLSDTIVDCMATSYGLTRRSVHHFDSREARKDPAFDFYLRDVVRSATAAPTFFEPARVHAKGETAADEHVLIDGAIYANNPAMIAFTEAHRGGAADIVLVSLGTGDQVEAMPWDEVQAWGLAQWARPILNVVFDSASESVDYQLQHLLGPERYHRFQVPLRRASHRLDDISARNIEILCEEAGAMIAQQDEELDHLCQKLER